jgi:tetratricopeptide (TPR) repeat protein
MVKIITVFTLLLIPLLGFSQRAKLYKDVPAQEYYNNGDLRVERNFKAGKLLGYKTFYKSGALRSNYVFNIKGYHDSIANFYYPNGKVKTVWNYKNDKVKKRIDYTLEGEVVKGKKSYKKLKICNGYLPYDKNKITWSFRRAKLNSGLGFYDEALEDFNFILSKVAPDKIRISAERSIYQSLAIAYTGIENYEKALMYNFKALVIDENNQAVLNNLGWLLLRTKDYDLALKYLNKCLEINPKNYYAFFNKAKLYLELGDYKKALDFIEKTIADERSHKLSKKDISIEKTIWAIRGEIYRKLGRLDEGIDDLQKAINENPVNSYAYRCLAKIYLEKNQLDKACNALAKADEYKFDKIYETNEVEDLLSEYCSSK